MLNSIYHSGQFPATYLPFKKETKLSMSAYYHTTTITEDGVWQLISGCCSLKHNILITEQLLLLIPILLNEAYWYY